MDNVQEKEWNEIVNTVYKVVKDKRIGMSYDITLSRVLIVQPEYQVFGTNSDYIYLNFLMNINIFNDMLITFSTAISKVNVNLMVLEKLDGMNHIVEEDKRGDQVLCVETKSCALDLIN